MMKFSWRKPLPSRSDDRAPAGNFGKHPIDFDQRREEPTVLFVHIPKTGGCTVAKYLQEHVPANKVAHYPIADTIAHLPEKAESGLYYVTHTPFYFSQLLPSPRFVFTWLRDPVDRAVSGYNHILSDVHHPWHHLLATETNDFESFIMHPRLRCHVVDPFTTFLGAEVNLLWFEGDRQSANSASQGAMATKPDRHTLARAITRLGEIDFIGFCDRMHSDCMHLAGALGLTHSDHVTHENSGLRCETIRPRLRRTADVEDLMRKHSPYDFELYAHARQIRGLSS